MQSHTQRLLAAAFILALTVNSGGCTSSHHQKTTDPAPVKDAPPYWCQLIPKVAINNVTGIEQELKQTRDIDIHHSPSSCEVVDEQRLPLEVQLALADDAKFQENETFTHHRSEMNLSPELGRTFFQSAPEVPNFTVAAAFRCGNKPVWIEIVLRVLQKGRDAKVDLPALLKIAEARYSSLAACRIEA
jgi:hypothetical protein